VSLALGLALACARPVPPPSELPPAPPPAPEVRKPPPPPCLRIERLVVHKGERRLYAHCEGGMRVPLRVALGRDPVGHKQRAGDHRTPEGDYRIAGPPVRSRFHRFVPIDYPSRADADAALAARHISPADHARILAAHRRGVPPPDDTPLGGNVGLHGEGARWRGESAGGLDWTYGCIALADGDLDFVIDRVKVGTPISILGPDAPSPAAEAGP
jgi:murein L,D-transpeptidase YafK